MEDKTEQRSIVLRKAQGVKDVKKLGSPLEQCSSIEHSNNDKSTTWDSTVKCKIQQFFKIFLKKSPSIECKHDDVKVPGLATTRNETQSLVKLSLSMSNGINCLTEERFAPLYGGPKHTRIDIIKQILENIARVNTGCAVGCGSPNNALNNELISLVCLLLYHGIDRDCDENWKRNHNSGSSKSTFDRFTPLHLAIKNNNLDADRLLSIVCLLINYGADIELKDKFGRTPLYLAIELKKLDVAKCLLVSGANINCVTTSYSTPLLASLINVDVASIRYLLKHGAKADVKNYKNESSLHVAIRVIDDKEVRYGIVQLLLAYGVKINDRDSEKSTALHLALEKEDFCLFYLLISRGSFIHLKNSYGFSPLHVAVARNLLEEAKILLKLGANVNDSDNHKITILAEAVEQGNEDMIELLLRHNANVADKNAVLVAADNGNVNIMKILISKGADVNAVDKVGLSVLVHAILFKQNAMVQYLLDNGADINSENKSFMPLTYSFLLYNFNAFIIRNPSEKKSYKLIMHLVLKCIALKNALGLHVHVENVKLIRTKDVIKTKYEDYSRELAIMRRTKVSADTAVTYFDLLVKRHSALVQCLRCAKVRDKLLSGDYKSLFVEYSRQMEKNVNEGLSRWRMITRFEASLNEVLKSVLPCNVTYKICEYFSDDDVKKYFREQ